jgi:cytochrome b subunit of formate dehydrogenase
MKTIGVKNIDGKFYFQRLTFNQRIQHIAILFSFTLTAITGLPLKFHHTHWGEILYACVGGITYAPIFHRVGAVIMTLGFFFHVFYVIVCAWKYYLLPLKQNGTLTLKTGLLALASLPMVPNLTDLKELMASMKYFFFITSERPSLVAHGLKEKFGYLAVFWGIPVIGTSGYFLWGESLFTKFFTGNVLNFAYIAHSDEAFLASIVIFIWHIYNVHLTPAVFPMGKAWINGYVGEQEMMQYHYEDYVHAMQGAGLEKNIKPLTQSYVYEGSFIKKAFMKLFMLVMFFSVIVSSYFISKVIYESVFVFGYQIVTTEPVIEAAPLVEPKFLEEIRLEDKEQKKLFRGFRFLQEKKIKDHYHRIELDIAPDDTSHCIECHGDLPHGKSVHIRSFLNMHNLYFACQTCHVRPKKDQKHLHYYWYHRSTGELVFEPEIGNDPIDSLDIKLTPCETCEQTPDRETIEAERDLTDDYMIKIQMEETSIEDKKNIVEQIHSNVSEQPVSCKECHVKKNPFLPLEEAGYSMKRISIVADDQITKMINEYKEFHTPSFLEPGKRLR